MKSIFAIFISTIAFSLSIPVASAFEKSTFVNYVFPIHEIVQEKNNLNITLDLPKAIYSQATASATPITWLLDYQVLSSTDSKKYFKDLTKDQTQEIGALLEISRALASQVGLRSRHSEVEGNLNSYYPLERKKLIDAYMEKFFEGFGFYPKVVGANYLDSFSLEYLSDKYSVNTAVYNIPSPQSNNIVQGVFKNFPYFPSRTNSLAPSQSTKSRLPVVLVAFNPGNAFGDSFISDPNIFEKYLHDLSSQEFNQFSQVTVGTSNQIPDNSFLANFKVYQQVTQKESDINVIQNRLSEFGEWFAQRYSQNNPAFFIKSTMNNKTSAIYFNPFYQIKVDQTDGQSVLSHLTIFNNIEAEDYRQNQNFRQTMELSTYPLVNNLNQVKLDLDLQNAQVSSQSDLWKVNLTTDEGFVALGVHEIGSSTHLDVPTHPSYSLNETTIKFNSNWSPYHYNKSEHLTNFIKFFALVLFVLYLLKLPPQRLLKLISDNFGVSVLIIFGALAWTLTTWQSGKLTLSGLGIWGAHSHDAFFHLSLIESFSKHPFSFSNPNLYGTTLQNYHFFYDYLLGILHKITSIPAMTLYFRFVPFITALAIGALSASLLRRLKFSTPALAISLLSIYFTGSLGFIFSFLQGHSFFDGESLFWMTQSVTTLVNPPFAFSLAVLLGILLLLDHWQNRLTIVRIIILSLLVGSLIQIKAYASVLIVTSLGLTTIISFIKKRNKYFKFSGIILFGGLVFTLAFFLPGYRSGNSLFIFSPLWFIRSIFAAQDRLDLNYVATVWNNSLAANNYLKLALIHLFGVFIFLVGNLGIRLLALPQLFELRKHKSISAKLIVLIICIGLLIPLFFIQSGNSWNSIQFSYYSLFFLNLLIGPVLIALFSRSRNLFQLLALIFVIALCSLPTTIGSLKNYSSPNPSTYIPYPELRQLEILKRQPEGLTLIPAYNEASARQLFHPKPLFAFDSTSYVGSLAAKPTYFADDINLDIMGYSYQHQKTEVQRFYATSDQDFREGFLNKNKFSYIYIDPLTNTQLDSTELDLRLLFDAGGYKLYTKN